MSAKRPTFGSQDLAAFVRRLVQSSDVVSSLAAAGAGTALTGAVTLAVASGLAVAQDDAAGTLTLSLSAGPTTIDDILTDGNGDVLSDGNGDVVYE